MPRLHIWLAGAVTIPSLIYGAYYKLQVQRGTELQESEMGIEAQKFSSQQLFQRLKTIQSYLFRTNEEKFRIATELAFLRNEVESGKFTGMGYYELESILKRINELEALRCLPLQFRTDSAPTMHQLWMGIVYIGYVLWSLTLDLLPLTWSRKAARMLLNGAGIPWEYIDDEALLAKKARGEKERKKRTEGTANAIAEKKATSVLLLSEDDNIDPSSSSTSPNGHLPDVKYVAAPPRCWIEDLALQASVPGNKELLLIAPKTGVTYSAQVTSLLATKGRLNPEYDMQNNRCCRSFGYPIPLGNILPKENSGGEEILYRPLLIRGTEQFLELRRPRGVEEVAAAMKEERRLEILNAASPYGNTRKRKRDESGRLERHEKPETEGERDARLERISFPRRLFVTFKSEEDRLHPFDVLMDPRGRRLFVNNMDRGSAAAIGPLRRMQDGALSLNFKVNGNPDPRWRQLNGTILTLRPKLQIKSLIRCEGQFVNDTAVEAYYRWASGASTLTQEEVPPNLAVGTDSEELEVQE
jgi:hypothetical protein